MNLSITDLFVLVYICSLIVALFLGFLFVCNGSSIRKEKKVKTDFDKKRGGLRL